MVPAPPDDACRTASDTDSSPERREHLPFDLAEVLADGRGRTNQFCGDGLVGGSTGSVVVPFFQSHVEDFQLPCRQCGVQASVVGIVLPHLDGNVTHARGSFPTGNILSGPRPIPVTGYQA
jgi:hypothetical protein